MWCTHVLKDERFRFAVCQIFLILCKLGQLRLRQLHFPHSFRNYICIRTKNPYNVFFIYLFIEFSIHKAVSA